VSSFLCHKVFCLFRVQYTILSDQNQSENFGVASPSFDSSGRAARSNLRPSGLRSAGDPIISPGSLQFFKKRIGQPSQRLPTSPRLRGTRWPASAGGAGFFGARCDSRLVPPAGFTSCFDRAQHDKVDDFLSINFNALFPAVVLKYPSLRRASALLIYPSKKMGLSGLLDSVDFTPPELCFALLCLRSVV
jgi:hypothetical protein